MGRRLTRRTFLKLAAAGLAGLATGCGATSTSPLPEVIPIAKKNFIAPMEGKKKLVRFWVSPTILDQMPTEASAKAWNQAHPEVEVQPQRMGSSTSEGGDWEARIIQQQQAGQLEWSGQMVMFPYMHIVARTESGFHQPLEDYIKASKVEGAKKLQDDLIPQLKEDGFYRGHLYGIPYGFDVEMWTYRQDWFTEVGFPKPPKTWQELRQACTEVKRKFGEKPDFYPYAWNNSLFSTYQPWIHTATSQPYNKEGLIDFAEEGLPALGFLKDLVEDGLGPPKGVNTTDNYTLARNSLTASFCDDNSRIPRVAKSMPESLSRFAIARMALKDPSRDSGSCFYGSCWTILAQAPYPQEMTDFFIYCFGPANKQMQQAIIESGKSPAYQSVYQTLLREERNARYADFMFAGLELVKVSVPYPRNNYWPIQNRVATKYMPAFLEKGSRQMAKEVAATMMQEITAEIAKLRGR